LLLKDMILTERADTLEVLGGVPSSWYMPGAHLRLDRVLTELGPFSLDLRISTDGEKCTLSVGKIPRNKHCAVRIVLGGLKDAGFTNADGTGLPAARDIPAGGEMRIALTARRK
jgi:hypothetical protein